MELLAKILVCFLAGAGAGIGTGFAGMSAAAVIGPMLMTFLGVPAYQAVGIGLASDVLASATSAWTYKKHKNLDVKNSLPLLIGVLVMTLVGSFVASLLPERAMSGTMQIAMIFIGLRFLLKPVKTTNVFIMAFTALTGGISHFAIGGMPDVTCLVLCVVFTLLWAKIAAAIANRASAVTLNRVVGIVMILTGIVILLVNYVF